MAIIYCTELKKPEPDFEYIDYEDGFISITYINEFTNGHKVAERLTILKSRYEINKEKYQKVLKKIFDKTIEDHFKYPVSV